MLAIITATRNSIQTIPECLESIGKVPGRIKHIIVDGGSTDGTAELVRSTLDGEPDREIHEQNGQGLYEALNQGITVALNYPNITHIGVLHSDDYLMVENFTEYVQFVNDSTADMVYSDIQYHTVAGNISRVWRAGIHSTAKVHTGWMPPHTSVIARSDLYRRFGLYNPDFGTAADYEWLVRVMLGDCIDIHYFPKRTVSMQIGGASNASLMSRVRANRMDGRVWAGYSRGRVALIRILKPMRKIIQFFPREGAQ